MKKLFALSVLFCGFILALAPVFASAGIIDCLWLGNPHAEPISQFLRKHGGRGEGTILGYLTSTIGMCVLFTGAIWAAVEFDQTCSR